jgi:hypothetical protein
VRFQLASWRFDRTHELIEESTEILVERNRIVTLAEVLGLDTTNRLRDLFEAGDLDAAAERAQSEVTALETIRRAGYLLAEPQELLESIGLLGFSPEGPLAAARDLYEAGEADASAHRAAEVIATREGAADAGRERVLVGGAWLLALEGAALAAIGVRRQRRLGVAAVR